jgi:hypothetical protein
MSDLSHKFNIVWAEMGVGKKEARGTRVYLEVSRILTGVGHCYDRTRDFTVWELRLAERVVERMRSGPVLPKGGA